jgi:hypothetical protein
MKRGLYKDSKCRMAYYTGRGWYLWLDGSAQKHTGRFRGGTWSVAEKWYFTRLHKSTALEFLLVTGEVYAKPTPIR